MKDNDTLIKEFIEHNIHNNAYYEYIKQMYDLADDQEDFIDTILECFNMYDAYYSIYTILDSIEDYLESENAYDTIEQVIYAEDFKLKSRW